MSFGTKVSGLFKGIKDKVTGWRGNDAKAVGGEEETVAQQGTLPQINNDHTMVSREALSQSYNFDAISSDKTVKKLLYSADNFEARMKSIRIPGQRDTAQEFINELSYASGDAIESIDFMQQRLTETAEALANKSKKYQGFVASCVHYATMLVKQKQFVTKILDNLYDMARSNNTAGIPYGKSYGEIMQDNGLTGMFEEKDDTVKKEIGHGQLNTVYAMKDNDGEMKVFKEGHRYATSFEKKEVGHRLLARKVGNGEELDLHSANRDVAVSVVDRLFGLNAAVKTSLAVSANGQTSSMQELAKGVDADQVYFMTGSHDSEYVQAMQAVIGAKSVLLGTGSDSEKTKKDYKKAENNVKKLKVVDPRQNSFIESCINLSALDLIVGHADRHNGNIMVSESGIKGIDNDTSFSLRGVASPEVEKKLASGTSFKGLSDSEKDNDMKKAIQENGVMIENDGQAVMFFHTNFPKVTSEFITKICSVTSGALRSSLKSLLTNEEIEACVNRTVAFQNYLKSLTDDKIIKNWSDLDSNAYIRDNVRFGFSGTKMNDTRGNYMAQIGSSAYNAASFQGADLWSRIDDEMDANVGPAGVIKTYLTGKKTAYGKLDNPTKTKLASATFMYLVENISKYENPTIAQLAANDHFDEVIYHGAVELVKHTKDQTTIKNIYMTVFGNEITAEKAKELAELNG